MTTDGYLLDTNILIGFFTKQPETLALLTKVKKSGPMFTSLLAVAEIRTGWNEKDTQAYLPTLYALFEPIGISPAIAELAGAWRREYKERGITLSSIDTLIAATAYEYRLALVTRNRKHFPMSEVTLYPEALA